MQCYEHKHTLLGVEAITNSSRRRRNNRM